MVPDPRQLLDEGCHARKGPQVGLVAAAHGARDQSLHDLLGLGRCEPGLAACLPLAGKACLAALLPRRLPSVGHLTAHPQLPPDLRGRSSLVKHRGRPDPPLFHQGMISFQRHGRRMHAHDKRHRIMRVSIESCPGSAATCSRAEATGGLLRYLARTPPGRLGSCMSSGPRRRAARFTGFPHHVRGTIRRERRGPRIVAANGVRMDAQGEFRASSRHQGYVG